MGKIERQYRAHFIDASFGGTTTDYERLGKDLESYAEELNPQTEVRRNILGEQNVNHQGYQVQSSVEPFYCYEDEPLLPEWDGGAMGGRSLHKDGAITVAAPAGELRIHPNPANSTLTVESDSPVREIAVYDMAGHAVMVETCHGASLQHTLNLSSLHAGIYLVKVVTANGTETAKFVKN